MDAILVPHMVCNTVWGPLLRDLFFKRVSPGSRFLTTPQVAATWQWSNFLHSCA